MKSRIIKDYLAYLWLSFFHCFCDVELESRNSVGRVDDSMTLGMQANGTLAVLGDGYNGGRRASTLGGFNDPNLLSFNDRNA